MPDTNVAFLRQTPASSRASVPAASPFNVEHYETEVPQFIELALHALYGSVFSSMAHFRVHGGLEDASTFVLRKDRDITAVFLFRVEGKRTLVLNEGMEIDETSIAQFAEFIFQRYASADFISFNGVAHSIRELAYPFSECFRTDDSVITLPDSSETYLKSLGKATRKNIKQYLARVQRDYPTFEFRVHDGRTVDPELIRMLIAFNRKRFEKKGKESAITEQDEQKIIQMIRACGIVGTISIDGSLCGGSLVYVMGAHYHSWLKAYDPAYDDYRLGLIGSFLMISECIQRGGKTFHLSWGREPHKALLNSTLRSFFDLTVYRNPAAAFRNCTVMFRQIYQHRMRQGKLWLLDMNKKSNGVFLPVKASLDGLRKLRTRLPDRD